MAGEGFLDLAVPWHRLTDSSPGILKPVVPAAVANQQAARLCDFANQVGSLSFTIDDPTVPQAQARDQAIVKAKAKAEDMAIAGGF